MDNLMKYMGLLHFLLFVFTAVYVFFFRTRSVYDIAFILYFLLVNIHWVFLNGECIVAYLYKKYYDQEYKPGESPSELSDIANVLPRFLNMQALVIVVLVVYLYNVYVVTLRNDFNRALVVALITSYAIYVGSMRTPYKSFTKNYSYLHLVLFAGALVTYVAQLVARNG